MAGGAALRSSESRYSTGFGGRTVPARRHRTPSYRLHRPSRQAVVTLDGRDIYLGPHGSPESRAEYDRLVAEWLLNGRSRPPEPETAPAECSVNELLVAYLRWADSYYIKGGRPTSEPGNIRLALRPVRLLYGHVGVGRFGPVALKAVRQAMIDAGLCRGEVNKRVRHVVRAFKWGVSEELVPAGVHHGLKSVAGLRAGQANVRESEPVRPVPDESVEAVRPYVSRQVWAMIQLQRLTGMRPGEACCLRPMDVDRAGEVWVYTPERHKTEHHGKDRRIYLGPRARAVLAGWLERDPDRYAFSPREATAERLAALRARRKSPVPPSQRNRARRSPRSGPGDRYRPTSYGRAILYGLGRANRDRARSGLPAIPHWHPHQLRHSLATELRRRFGLDAARAVLGHTSPAVTEIYAEVDGDKAAEAMRLIG